MTPLNGDAKMIYDKIKSVEDHDAQMHKENKESKSNLEKKIDALRDKLVYLPCSVHVEKFKQFEDHISEGGRWRLAVFSIAVGLLVTIGGGLVSWGTIKQQMQDHIRMSERFILDNHKIVDKVTYDEAQTKR